MKNLNQQSISNDVRLNRSLEENEKLRSALKFSKLDEKVKVVFSPFKGVSQSIGFLHWVFFQWENRIDFYTALKVEFKETKKSENKPKKNEK